MDSEAINVRMEREMIERIDSWRESQENSPNRPEAIRRLVEKGLERG